MPGFRPNTEVHYLRDKTCSTDLLSGLNELRKQKILCDVNIKVGDQTFPAHKTVLIVASGYFRSMFTMGFSESNSSEVTIQEGTSDAFVQLLRFAYTGMLRLSQTNVVDILSLACFMQFSKAIELCTEYVKDVCNTNGLPFEKAHILESLGELHNVPKLSKTANRYMTMNFIKWTKSKGFLEVEDVDAILECLRRTDIVEMNKVTETNIFDCVLRWLMHDWSNRKDNTQKLFKEVRLGLVSMQYLRDNLAELDKFPECQILLQSVIDFKEDARNQNPLTLAREWPSLCANRTTVSAPICVRGPTRMDHESLSYYYDKTQKGWTHMPFAGPRVDGHYTRKHSYIVVNEELYAAGGLYEPPESKKPLKTTSFSKYNPDTNTWIPLCQMKTQRVGCILMETDEYIYALGGSVKSSGNALNTSKRISMEKYNIKENKWSMVQFMPTFCNYMCGVGFKSLVLVNAGVQLFIYKFGNGWIRQVDAGRETIGHLSPLELLTVYKSNHYPVLTVHNDKCYFVTYKDEGSAGWEPTVHELCFNEKDEASKNTVTISDSCAQKGIPANNCGAFVIDCKFFVNIKGYAHNTGIDIMDPLKQSKMDQWKQVTSIGQTIVGYTFDLQRLRDKPTRFLLDKPNQFLPGYKEVLESLK